MGFTDLLLVLDGWGPCDDCEACPSDTNGDCSTDVGDVLLVLNAWS